MFSYIFNVFYGIFGVYIFPKWLKKVPGHFGILFGWFRELRKFCQNMVPETSGLLPKCYKKCKKNMEASWEHIFVNMGHRTFWKFAKSVCPGNQILFDCVSILWGFSCVLFRVYILKIILRRWGIGNDTFSIIKQHPNLNMNFISIKKNMKRKFGKFSIFM